MRKDQSGCNGEKMVRHKSFMNHVIVDLVIRMSKVCESWSLEDLVALDDEDMEVLLSFYKPGTVPKFEQIRHRDTTEYTFDGSFGWW